MMKSACKWLTAFAAAALLLISCGSSKEDGVKLSVDGCWELTSVSTKSATVGDVTVNVYLEFSGEAFTLYQKIGEGRYTRFTGTFTLNAKESSLSGNYSDGKSWGPYAVACSGENLSLTKDSETDTYKKIDAIPASVASNTY